MKYFLFIVLLCVSTTVQAQELGKWVDDGPGGIGTVYTIYQSKGSYHLKRVHHDGSKGDLKIKKSGSKFIHSAENAYYVISKSGTLKCYDRQGLVFEARSINQPKEVEQDTSGGQSCYDLGVKYGRCATLSMKGKVCNPNDDIVIPPRCRGNADTQRGIEAGTRSVF